MRLKLIRRPVSGTTPTYGGTKEIHENLDGRSSGQYLNKEYLEFRTGREHLDK